MPQFSEKSLEQLKTVHPDLQTLFIEVIKHRDCTIVEGLRTQERQQELFALGRDKPGDVVTNADGITHRSKHQDGNAIDVVPYPERYDEDALIAFGNFVKGIAVMLRRYGAIDNDIEWGGDWRFIDRPHWQL